MVQSTICLKTLEAETLIQIQLTPKKKFARSLHTKLHLVHTKCIWPLILCMTPHIVQMM
jgi:hypothetical protein